MSNPITKKLVLIWRWLGRRDRVRKLNTLGLFLFSFWGLWLPTLSLTGDQKTHLAHAIEMRSEARWLIPIFGGEPSYFKPPLTHDLILIGWKWFGFGFLGSLFAFALALALTAWFLGAISGKTQVGWIFLSSVGALMFGYSAQMEILLALCWAAALKCVSDRHYRWAWLIAGFSAWIKSPVYFVLLAASILLGHFLLEKPKNWRSVGALLKKTLVPFFLASGLAASWYLYVLLVDRDAFIQQYWVREHLLKLQGNGVSFGKMGLEFLLLCIPWTVFLLAAIFNRNPVYWAFVAPLLAFLWWTPYRMDTYLFPLFGIAIVMASTHRRSETLIKSSAGVWALVLIPLTKILSHLELLTLPLGTLFAASTVFAVLGIRRKGVALSVTGVVLSLFAVRMTIHEIAQKDFAPLEQLRTSLQGRTLAIYDPNSDIWNEVSWVSLAWTQPILRVRSVKSLDQHLTSGGAILLDHHTSADLLKHFRDLKATEWAWPRIGRGLQGFDWKAALTGSPPNTTASQAFRKIWTVFWLSGRSGPLLQRPQALDSQT